jgi:hypothetical protein
LGTGPRAHIPTCEVHHPRPTEGDGVRKCEKVWHLRVSSSPSNWRGLLELLAGRAPAAATTTMQPPMGNSFNERNLHNQRARGRGAG